MENHQKTSDIETIKNRILSANQKTLVVFDVDYVLLKPESQLLRNSNEWYIDKYLQNCDCNLIVQNNFAELFSSVLLQRKAVPVNESFIHIIRELQANDIKVLALTNCITGKFGYMASVEDWRIQELQSLGYHFERSWELPAYNFTQLTSGHFGSCPIFKQGVILTNNVPKGEVLKEFLNYAVVSPERIIFIDDVLSNIKSVETIANELGIEFAGIEYTAAEEQEAVESLNEERARLQMDVLTSENILLSDQEADLYLNTLQSNQYIDLCHC